jgi:hypothetical protein
MHQLCRCKWRFGFALDRRPQLDDVWPRRIGNAVASRLRVRSDDWLRHDVGCDWLVECDWSFIDLHERNWNELMGADGIHESLVL